MNIKINQSVANIIGIFLATILIASACSPAATPSPTAIPATPTPDPIGLVKAYEEAFNRHDLDAVMALFADDAATQNVWFVGSSVISKPDISLQHDYSFGRNHTIQNSECSMDNDTVTCQAVTWDDCTKAAGLDGLHYKSVKYVFEDKKINKVTGTIVGDDYAAMGRFNSRLIYWTQANRSEELDKVIDGEFLIINREAGEILAKLCQEFAAANP